MKLRSAAVGIVLAVVVAPALMAQMAQPAPARQTRVELAPFVGYRFGGSLSNTVTRQSYGINEAMAYGGVLELTLSGQNRFWLLYSRQETEIDTLGSAGIPITIQYIQGGGARDMTATGSLRPFVAGSLGVGMASGEGPGSSDLTKFALGMSLGVRTPGPRLSLRGEARGYLTFVGDQAGVGTCGGGGCQIAFTSSAVFQGELAVGVGLKF